MGTTEERWLDGIIDSMDMNLSKLQEMVKDKKAWCAVVHGIEKSWTRLSDRTTITKMFLLESPTSAALDPSEVIQMCLIAGPGRIPKMWQSSNFECVTHSSPRQNSLFESRRKDLRQQRKGGGVYWVAVLSLALDSRGVTGCFFANGRHRPLWVSFVSRRGWTGEPRTGTGKQEVEDLVILWGQARTDMEARQCLEGPKNVLPCGQQQAGSREPGARKEQSQAMAHAVGRWDRPVLPQQSASQSLLALEPDLTEHPALGCWVWGCRGDCRCWEGRLLLFLLQTEGTWGAGYGVVWLMGEWLSPRQPTTPHSCTPPHQAVSPQACYVDFPTRHGLTEKCVNPVTPASQAFGKLLDRG